jgi:hypothetical protein
MALETALEMALEMALKIAVETVGEKRVKKRENEKEIEIVTKTERKRKRKHQLPEYPRENDRIVNQMEMLRSQNATNLTVTQLLLLSPVILLLRLLLKQMTKQSIRSFD